MKFHNHYKTIVISDIALGASPEYFKKLISFLKNTSSDKLIFCGDIIKGWQDQKINMLSKYHHKFLKTLFKLSEQNNTEIVFVVGSEWDFQNTIPSFRFSGISFVKEYKFKSGGNSIYILPEEYNSLSLGASLHLSPVHLYKYHLLLWINKKYNSYRINHGKEYFSLLKKFNYSHETFSAHYLSENFKTTLVRMCQSTNSNGIICSHPLQTSIFRSGEIIYMSVGFWTESLTAIAESNYGQWQTLTYHEIMEQKAEDKKYENMIEVLFRKSKR